MEYEKKYKEALKWVQKLYSLFEGWVKEDAEHYFPELKSEDEKIRKAIHIYLDWLDGRKDYQPKGAYTIKDMIAWLENQKDYIKLPNSAYTSNRDINEFADKYSHTIWENLMDNFKKIENYSIGCNDISDLVLNAIIHTYYWLEKQGENKSDFSNIRVWKYIVATVLTEENGIGQYLDNPDTERIAKRLQERYGNIEKQGKKTSITQTLKKKRIK